MPVIENAYPPAGRQTSSIGRERYTRLRRWDVSHPMPMARMNLNSRTVRRCPVYIYFVGFMLPRPDYILIRRETRARGITSCAMIFRIVAKLTRRFERSKACAILAETAHGKARRCQRPLFKILEVRRVSDRFLYELVVHDLGFLEPVRDLIFGFLDRAGCVYQVADSAAVGVAHRI